MYEDHPYGRRCRGKRPSTKMKSQTRKVLRDNSGARGASYVAGKFDVATVKKAIEAGFSVGQRARSG